MLRLGRVDYLNVLPIYYAFESGAVPLAAETIRGVPALLNQKFMAGQLDITPISSIAYARQPQAGWVLPDVSISADGPVASILLFTRKPVKELNGETIAVTTSSATSVVLLQILLERHYGIHCTLQSAAPELEPMLTECPAALLIGDDALQAAEDAKSGLLNHLAIEDVIDLGQVWKEMTGLPMVYALWAIRDDYVRRHDREIDQVAQAFRQARSWADKHAQEVLAEASRRYSLPLPVLDDYFHLIRYDLDDLYRKAAETYFAEAARLGILPAPVKLQVWGEV
ncbi:menaquinone biosynthesis protein [Heliobacterium chlorum]|uniref:Chorismate dehydratase n=1 Tax=Heliobacterium chlorum TaxID=2698 RepID=A0ABR7SX74_HELCL|nr:menaquinone biosynthesis protein [Heliobacterium chlorum]MBC9783153.1 menaquinone biosynthesis protein [Heliobacterium chlorum]